MVCPRCRGKGETWGDIGHWCHICGGRGKIIQSEITLTDKDEDEKIKINNKDV